VRLFFVLSGFLITRILLTSRPSMREFYIRRGLRIFPLFYLVLALAAMINIGPVRSTIGWHVSYLTNAYLFQRGDWHGSISHLWSLAVEEQFYLVWPWLMLLVPERRLPAMIAAMICLAPISRLLTAGAMTSVLPLSCVDALGVGALLAFPASRLKIMSAGFLAGVPVLIAGLLLRHEILTDVGVSLTAAWIVGRAARGFQGTIGALLTARPVMYVGTISYGLYLYHGFMPYVLGRYVPGFVGMPLVVRVAMLASATLLTAVVSWRFFEAPILRFKDALSDRARLQEPVHHVRVDAA
jgi:peptidoglycan/LPS O-acetylase OafA/YrhL